MSEADGVHLGHDDLPIHEARRILGPDALIGVSTHNLEQVRRAILEGANYLGVGPTFSTGCCVGFGACGACARAAGPSANPHMVRNKLVNFIFL